MTNKDKQIFFVILIVILFLVSAYNKIKNFNKVSEGLKTKISESPLFNWITYDISKISLLFGIILLLAGSGLLLHGIYKEIKSHKQIGGGSLILFLILATILYHPINNPNEMNNILKNISLLGGIGYIIV
jgi:ABC-type multidrug transport system fused ATPase/permease subunit